MAGGRKLMIATQIRSASSRIAAGSVAALLIAFLAYRANFNLSSATSVQLFLVAAIALRWGLLEASIVSLLSVAGLDFFFAKPLFVFFVNDSHDWVALGTFETVAILISTLSNQVNHHAREAERHQVQLQKLYELSERILLLDHREAVDQELAELIQSILNVQGVAVWNAYNLKMSRAGNCDVSDHEVRSTYYMNMNRDGVRDGVSRRVLRLGTRPIGSLFLYGHILDAASVNATATLTAIAIERHRSFTTEANAEAARQSEQLRSAILDGLAHAFKSPLTTIMTSSSGLLAMNTLAGTEKTLVGLIDRHAGHLNDLSNHLLLTARLDRGDLTVKRDKVDLADLIQSSIEACSHELDGRVIDVQLAERQSTVWADKKLFQMALIQLLDNAVKYGKPGSSIAIGVQERHSELHITVKNEGSFIPPAEREKVFDRFYRYSRSSGTTSGTGIGLSVVRRITEAHHGRAWVNSDPVNGTTFVITLPRMAREG
jgi:two-component system sensor histidine kinase KdpD